MTERYFVLVDGDPVHPVDAKRDIAFADVRSAIIEAEAEVARREFRQPHALPWAPTFYGWITSNGRAKLVRKDA